MNGRTLAVAVAAIGIACGAVTQRQLPPAGSARDDGTGVLSQASVALRTAGLGGAGYGGVRYAAAGYGGSVYGGGRYASYQFARSRGNHRNPSTYLDSYSHDDTRPTGAIAGTLAWRTPVTRAKPSEPGCPDRSSRHPIDAVVSVDGVRRGRGFTEQRLALGGRMWLAGVVEIGRCAVHPRVHAVGPIGDYALAVLARGERARLDGVASASGEVLFEVELTSRGERRHFRLAQAGIVELRATGAAAGWIAVLGHPLFSMPDPDGSFFIPRVPVGEHTIRVWHPPVEGTAPIVSTHRVRVQQGKTARLAIKSDPRPARRTPAAGSGGR